MHYTRKTKYRETPEGKTVRRIHCAAKRACFYRRTQQSLRHRLELERRSGANRREDRCLATSLALVLYVAPMEYKQKGLGGFDFSHLDQATMVAVD